MSLIFFDPSASTWDAEQAKMIQWELPWSFWPLLRYHSMSWRFVRFPTQQFLLYRCGLGLVLGSFWFICSIMFLVYSQTIKALRTFLTWTFSMGRYAVSWVNITAQSALVPPVKNTRVPLIFGMVIVDFITWAIGANKHILPWCVFSCLFVCFHVQVFWCFQSKRSIWICWGHCLGGRQSRKWRMVICFRGPLWHYYHCRSTWSSREALIMSLLAFNTVLLVQSVLDVLQRALAMMAFFHGLYATFFEVFHCCCSLLREE